MPISLAPAGPELVLAFPWPPPLRRAGESARELRSMITEVFGRNANGGTSTVLFFAEIETDLDTQNQRLEMLERMRYQARVLPGEGACGSTGTCRGPQRVCPGRQNDALNV